MRNDVLVEEANILDNIIIDHNYKLLSEKIRSNSVPVLRYLVKKAEKGEISINSSEDCNLWKTALNVAPMKDDIEYQLIDKLSRVYENPIRKSLEDGFAFTYGIFRSFLRSWNMKVAFECRRNVKDFFSRRSQKRLIGRIYT